jgi:DNA polymerase I-like protein with 3'-5' exonuclease and polymerase domains
LKSDLYTSHTFVSVCVGSASDIIKFAMLSVENAIDEHPLFGVQLGKMKYVSDFLPSASLVPLNPMRPMIISQIHDEVIYDVPLAGMYSLVSYFIAFTSTA